MPLEDWDPKDSVDRERDGDSGKGEQQTNKILGLATS